MKKLSLGLKKLLKLNYLDLSGNKIDHQAAESLGSVLSLFRNLGTLKLGSNALCKDGAAHLTQSLAYLTQLKELNLNSNYLEDKGVSEVCLSLTFLLHLKVLELQDNTLTEASTTKILESVNENIEVLNLSWNSIGSQSIYQFLSHFRNLRKFVCYGATPETSLKTRKFNCSLYI
uniref:Toll-like receptor 3 n=1 Tax=Fabrea salina TaxID=342563 RepID=A0A7S3IC64_9CILI|mmetsp:Transcript_453/g.775  ORF Transcript_453/g.775 Transcript_453/m.775 type:complete len:175 (+) Transcript_453:1-525(+)